MTRSKNDTKYASTISILFHSSVMSWLNLFLCLCKTTNVINNLIHIIHKFVRVDYQLIKIICLHKLIFHKLKNQPSKRALCQIYLFLFKPEPLPKESERIIYTLVKPVIEHSPQLRYSLLSAPPPSRLRRSSVLLQPRYFSLCNLSVLFRFYDFSIRNFSLKTEEDACCYYFTNTFLIHSIDFSLHNCIHCSFF